ncbi:MAG: PaaI family thioesterase [Candidatus Competibacterales bacterium]|nr:PaaI family thioesterase [Candidatus Competibacterales bacterium]
MNSDDFAAFFEEICQFDRFLGLHLTVEAPGRIRYRLQVGEAHLSMPGACHGGVLAAMMDAVLGLTALSRVFPEGHLCQTVEFKINYLTAVTPGTTLEGQGHIEFAGSRLMVVTGTLTNLDSGQPVAKGTGTFSLYPLERKRQLLEYLPEGLRWLTARDDPPTP